MYPAYLVFYGTLTTIVRAPDEASAYASFIAAQFPESERGRIVPPRLDEVRIRLPRESDREWLADSGSLAFMELLTEITAAAH